MANLREFSACRSPKRFTVPKGPTIDPKSIRIYQTEPNDYLAPVVEGTSKSLEEAIRKLSFGSKGNVAHVPQSSKETLL